MIRILHTLFFVLATTLLSYSQKTDWEEMGLNGKVRTMTKTEYKATDSNGVVKKLYAGSLVTIMFNEAGFKTKWIRFDAHTKEIDESWEYLYDNSGKLKNIYSKDYHGKISFVHQFYYDEKGNQIGDTIIEEDAKVSTVYVFTYNEKSECTEMNGYNMKKNAEHFLTQVYKYDAKGNQIEQTEHFYENGKESSTITRTFSYDNKTNRLQYETYDSKGPYSLDGGPDKTTYIYDKRGELTQSTWGNMKGDVASSSIYNYGRQGNWVEKTTYENNKPVAVTTREIEYYE